MRPDVAHKNISRGGVLGTDSADADQVIVTYTPTNDFYLEEIVASVSGTSDIGLMYLETPAGTKVQQIYPEKLGSGAQSARAVGQGWPPSNQPGNSSPLGRCTSQIMRATFPFSRANG